MPSDSLFTGIAGFGACETAHDAREQPNVASASECTKAILAERFGQANAWGIAAGEDCPMSVIGLKH